MKNVMKSIWYEIFHRKTPVITFLAFALTMIVMGFSSTADATFGFTKGGVSDMLAAHPWMPYEFPVIFLSIFVGSVCCDDYKDKVANYEILSGHSRKSIFLARSLTAILVGTLLTMFLSFLPLVTGYVLAGWGSRLALGDMLLRYFLLGLPYLRLAAFLTVIAFLCKNPYVMIGIGSVLSLSLGAFSEMFQHSKTVFVSLFNMILLTQYQGWSNYNLDPVLGVVRYYAYDSVVTREMVAGTIVASLLMTTFYLFMGYALFRRDELN